MKLSQKNTFYVQSKVQGRMCLTFPLTEKDYYTFSSAYGCKLETQNSGTKSPLKQLIKYINFLGPFASLWMK